MNTRTAKVSLHNGQWTAETSDGKIYAIGNHGNHSVLNDKNDENRQANISLRRAPSGKILADFVSFVS